MVAGKLSRAGFVSTNSIRNGANREVLTIIGEHGCIFNAWSDQPWFDEKGAAVRVSLVCFAEQNIRNAVLNGQPSSGIYANLTSADVSEDFTKAKPLASNVALCTRGIETGGPFEISHDQFSHMVSAPLNPNGMGNREVLRKIINGSEALKRPKEEYVIDFGNHPDEAEAALFERPFEALRSAYEHYKLQSKRRVVVRENWWLHRRSGKVFRDLTAGMDRFIVTTRVAKHRIFLWMADGCLPDTRLAVIARNDDVAFGILSSLIHEKWSLSTCSWHGVGNDPTYNVESCFETFPFPEGLTPNIPAADYADDPRAIAIATAAARLNELRENWLNPADLVVREPEVVPGYPDRILPRDESAAAELKKRTLTNLYNARPAWLDNAHKALDEAVAEAYGWGEDYRAGALTEDEILARLFRLNQERAAA